MKTDKICLYESVGKLKEIRKKREARLNEMNIHTIFDLQKCVRSNGLTKAPIRCFNQIYEHGLEALPRNPMISIKDHRKAKNLYLLRYGERWLDKLKSSSFMSKFWYITDLVHFMVKEGEKLMKGSEHEDDFLSSTMF